MHSYDGWNRLVSYDFMYYPKTYLATADLYIYHTLYAISYIITTLSLYNISAVDPGYIKQKSIEEKNQIVMQLADIGRLTPRDYCVTCRVLFYII